jgi:hypothetical protein
MLRIRHRAAAAIACVAVLGLVGPSFADNPGVILDYNAAKVLGPVHIASGWIDLTNGSLIATTSSVGFVPAGGQANEYGTPGTAEYGASAVHDAIQEGSNYATGFWNGQNGIRSSTAASDPNTVTAVGYVDNQYTQYGTFWGKSLDTTNYSQSIFATTWYGDANLDGIVNGGDYDLLAGTILSGTTYGPKAEWLDGDFNGDGVVDGADYDLLAGTLLQGKGQDLGFSPSAVAGGSVKGVPEPTTLGLLAALGVFGWAACLRRKAAR